MSMTSPRRLSALTLAVVLGAGCAKKPEPAAEQALAPAPAPVVPPTVVIHASDYALQAPDTIPGGWVTLRLDNSGKELHHAGLVRLDQGKTAADLAKLGPTDPPPAWAIMMGGPNAAAPGGPAVETTLKLAPGNYVILCVIPSPDHMPHFTKGMIRPLTVIAPTTAAAPPEADLTVTLVDYSFAFSKPVTAGKHTIRITTAPGQPHEFLVARLAPGKVAADLSKWIDTMNGPPPAMPVGGTTPLNAGEEAQVTINFAPGEYVLICFFPDAKDGKYHSAHGMMTQIKVS